MHIYPYRNQITPSVDWTRASLEVFLNRRYCLSTAKNKQDVDIKCLVANVTESCCGMNHLIDQRIKGIRESVGIQDVHIPGVVKVEVPPLRKEELIRLKSRTVRTWNE